MKTKVPLVLVAVILMVAVAAGAAAEGAGGPLYGFAMPSWNPKFMPAISTPIPELVFIGAYGYGVTSNDTIIGGFGLAFMDYKTYESANWSDASDVLAHASGGAGGMVLGSRIFGSRSAHLDLGARLGLGGLYVGTRVPSINAGPNKYRYDPSAYAIVYAEPYAELGLGLVPWFHLSVYLSYPYIGNFIPGKPLSDFSYYSPVIGLACTCGSFGRGY